MPEAQAVAIVSHGPRQPRRIETVAAPALAIIMGTRNGDTAPWAFFQQHPDLGLHRGEAPDPGADLDAGERRVDVDRARVGERHVGGGDGILSKGVDTAGLFGVEPQGGIEAAHPVLTFGSGTVQAREEGVLADPATRHDAESRDRDPAATAAVGPVLSVGHQSFEVTSS